MVCVCRPLQSQSILHIPLGGNMFISRHDMRLTYTYCDPRVLFLIGYDPSYLIGRSAYLFHNPVDAHKCSECHSLLIKTGSGVSAYYRFLGRTGVWVWMQTKATIVSDTRGQPQYVVCNNYIISEKEAERSHQMELQQQGQGHGLQAVPGGDLTAKGAIDLQPLSQVTSPVSSTDSEQEQHDDTGYNSAVSSIGSASTSPCPLNPPGGGGGGGAVEGESSSLSPRLLKDVAGLKRGKASADTRSLSPPQQHFGLTKDSPNRSGKVAAPSSVPPHHRQQLGVPHHTEKGSGKVLSLPEQGLGFHSTLSSAIYGEEFGGQDIHVTVPILPGAYSATDTILEQMGSHPTPSLSDEQSDPFLCSGGGQGQGRAEGSVSHVMEDMDILEDLLERIGDCDHSHDSVFTSSPPSSFPQGEAPSFRSQQHTSSRSQKTVGVNSQSGLTDGSDAKQLPSLFAMGVDSSLQPSLLRSLLDKEGKAIIVSPSQGQTWTKSVSDSGAVATFSAPSVEKGKVCAHVVSSKGTHQGLVGVKQQSIGGQTAGEQVLVYNGKQVVVPREVDLTQEDSGEGSEGEEKEGEEETDEGMEGDNQPPTLPDDLLDFAMQYCETLTDMDTALPEGMTGLETDWTSAVDDFMSKDTHLPAPSPAAKNVPRKSVTVPVQTAVKQSSQKQCDTKHKDLSILGKALTQAQPVSVVLSSGTQAQSVSSVTHPCTQPQPVGVVSPSHVLQSAIITSSTLKDLKPGFTISLKAMPTGGTVKGFVIEPVAKSKTAAMVKCGGGGVKCLRLLSPALSDHRYSSPHTRSPGSLSPRAASPSSTSIHPPSGKRMRTEWDKGAGGGKATGGGGGPSLLYRAFQSFPSPKPQPPPPSSPQVAHKALGSPASGLSSPRKPGSVDSSPASQPTSPTPTPIPANGGGKPLNAMSELEKHLRGLAAPPDEREPDNILTPTEESSGSGSRPFLERLLTGEISHERYRQIDYHLLYQERERRMSENGHSS
ncbi:uncharacterized protein [Littorina saxatilis]